MRRSFKGLKSLKTVFKGPIGPIRSEVWCGKSHRGRRRRALVGGFTVVASVVFVLFVFRHRW